MHHDAAGPPPPSSLDGYQVVEILGALVDVDLHPLDLPCKPEVLRSVVVADRRRAIDSDVRRLVTGEIMGAGLAKTVDQGIDVDFLKKLAEELTPGRAAVIVLISRTSGRDLLSEIGVPGRVIETSFDE
jgi:Protein of unknown function (DUF1269)